MTRLETVFVFACMRWLRVRASSVQSPSRLAIVRVTFGFETGRREAINDIQAEAQDLGADAVIGATFDYEEMGEGMVWVNLSGTAVTTRRE